MTDPASGAMRGGSQEIRHAAFRTRPRIKGGTHSRYALPRHIASFGMALLPLVRSRLDRRARASFLPRHLDMARMPRLHGDLRPCGSGAARADTGARRCPGGRMRGRHGGGDPSFLLRLPACRRPAAVLPGVGRHARGVERGLRPRLGRALYRHARVVFHEGRGARVRRRRLRLHAGGPDSFFPPHRRCSRLRFPLSLSPCTFATGKRRRAETRPCPCLVRPASP